MMNKKLYFLASRLASRMTAILLVLSLCVMMIPQKVGAASEFDKVVKKTYPSYVEVTVTKDNAPVWSLPCSDKTSKSAKKITTLSKGTILHTTMLYKNSAGNYWYRVECSEGTGYIFAENTKYDTDLYDEVSVTEGKNVPATLTEGSYFDILWRFETKVLPLGKVTGSILNHDGTKIMFTGSRSVDTTVCKLGGSKCKVDMSCKFNKLSLGDYHFIIEVVSENYHFNADKQRESCSVVCQTPICSAFSIVSASKTHYVNVNGKINGALQDHTKDAATFDVYINGEMKANDTTDFYEKVAEGSSYLVTDIKPIKGFTFEGTDERDPQQGTVTGYTEVNLMLNLYSADDDTSDEEAETIVAEGDADWLPAEWFPYETILELEDNAIFYEGPWRGAPEVAEAEAGDCVVITWAYRDETGDIWYESSTGYFVEERLTHPHTHTFSNVEGIDNIEICSCGSTRENASGLLNLVGDVAAATGPLDLGELAATLGAAGAAIDAALGALGATLPYVGIAVAAGVIIYYAAQSNGISYTLKDFAATYEEIDEHYKPDPDVYYDGVWNDEKSLLMINLLFPMDMEEAELKIGMNQSLRLLNEARSLATGQSGNFCWFIYTLKKTDAENLAKDYVSKHREYTYKADGTKTGKLPADLKKCMKQFQHYHITLKIDVTNHLGSHICYGAPCQGAFKGGAWKTA